MSQEDPIRVLVVDDSRLFRHAVKEALAGEPGLVVVGEERNGTKALEFLRGNTVDVVTLDLEMPELDGIGVLKALPPAGPGVIMLSAFTSQGASQTIAALAAGAFDFVTKPSTDQASDSIAQLKRHLGAKIRACAARRARRPSSAPLPVPVARPPTPTPVVPRPTVARSGLIRAVLIGVSTGGPKALMQMLPNLCKRTRLPILIVQHMPPKFTASLADSLGRLCSHKVVEAEDGMPVEDGWCFIAPGGHHLVVRPTSDGRVLTGVNDQPAEGGLRPAADVLFRSAASVYGGACVAVVLTGMGSDGTKGLAPLKRAGVQVVVQDEATSVVWGMPGSAVQAGLADQVLPLDAIPEAIARIAGR